MVSECTGLQKEGGLSFSHGQSRSFVNVEGMEDQGKGTNPNPSSYSLQADLVPSFVSDEEAKLIFETGKNLRIFRAHRPEHPLSETEAWGIKAPQLEWKFDWAHMKSVVEKANIYEKNLVAAIKQHGKRGTEAIRLTSETQTCAADHAENLVWADDNVQKRYIEDLAMEFDQSPLPSRTLPDELHDIVLLSLSPSPSPGTTIFAPPFSLVSALSFSPILHTQARLLNAALLRHFFRSCNFRHHLELQHRYHLFGDGVFATRLSSALFSPDLETAERHRGILKTGGSMGLRLGVRKTWPPASSELRLALMGVIGDTYFASTRRDHNENQPNRKRELPGGLSFSIRELSDAEIETIMDPDGLHALDFLRLQYAPPKPLDAIITPASLQKYDTIFRFLLRLLRVHFVTTHLVRPHPLRNTHRARTQRPNTSPTITRFTLEAHHVVSALLVHFSTSGVTEPWTALSARLDAIERRLAHEDESGQYGTHVTEGPDALGALHAAMLDTVLGALLLRGRQARARDALEALLDCVLAFAKFSQWQEHGDSGTVQQSGADAEIEADARYKGFRAKLSLFLDACKELSEKKGRGAVDPTWLAGAARARVSGEGGMIERLILALEMSEYYGLPVA
ncbi:hypothetical protein B0A49_00171 [Cryomyces minteri]|uniref:Spindle pole body component n=1 Tax=Cryomyces minteri TaxID=331657 RepID=A0A4U0Y1U8_9PEZI|nr:hypothetical protein B0A49_00171 [Cryomyces minteri]